MAPEQARGEPAGPASDVYSACLVVYEGLTGVEPRRRAVAGRHRAAGGLGRRAAPRPRPARPSPRLCRAVDAGLRHDPAARPDAVRLADELEGVLAGVRPGRAAPRAPDAARPGERRRWGGARRRGALDGRRPAGRVGRGRLAAARSAGRRHRRLAALAFAWRPRAARCWRASSPGRRSWAWSAPAPRSCCGALALVTLAAGWGHGRRAAAGRRPLLFAIGLGPLYAARGRAWCRAGRPAVGGGRRGRRRPWCWQDGRGGRRPDGGRRPRGARRRDPRRPVVAAVPAGRLWDPLAAHPGGAAPGAALVVGAMCVPLVLRAAPGGPRAVAAAVWVAALGRRSMVAVAPTRLTPWAPWCRRPGGVAWALRPWRVLRRRVPARTSATLRSPTA